MAIALLKEAGHANRSVSRLEWVYVFSPLASLPTHSHSHGYVCRSLNSVKPWAQLCCFCSVVLEQDTGQASQKTGWNICLHRITDLLFALFA